MSQGCGGIEFMEGGTLTNMTITSSHIVNSTLTGGYFVNSHIQGLSDIDPPSANVIAQAIASLDPASLRALADAIMNATTAKITGTPASTTATDIPGTIIGGRASLLGTPNAFAKFDETYSVPLYRTE